MEPTDSVSAASRTGKIPINPFSSLCHNSCSTNFTLQESEQQSHQTRPSPQTFSHIGDSEFAKPLSDSAAAGINLMHLSIFWKLGLEEVKPTQAPLQFADRSIICPYCIIEDVLIKVIKFYQYTHLLEYFAKSYKENKHVCLTTTHVSLYIQLTFTEKVYHQEIIIYNCIKIRYFQ